MATSKIVRASCAFVLSMAMVFSTHLVSTASDEAVTTEPASAVATEAAGETASSSCCPEGYECQPIESAEGEGGDDPPCHGVLTCVFWAGGHVIALPFRLLNAVFRIAI